MKKLFLLLAASSIGASSWAQQNSNALISSSARMEEIQANNKVTNPFDLSRLYKHAGANQKTTTVHANAHSEWFSYWDANETASSTLYYNTTAPDSNILDNGGTGTPYHVFCHGLGMSFDPTDDGYYQAAANYQIPGTQINDNTPYSVDSFFVAYQYFRHNNTTTAADSIIVSFVVTTLAADSGTFKLRFGASAANVAITPDSTPRFASAIYTRQNSIYGPNEVWDTITATKRRYAFPLVLADTTGGFNVLQFGMPALACPAKSKVVTFVSFKSAFATTLGTSDATNSNYIRLYSGTTANTATAWPTQTPHSSTYAGSYQTGLIAQNQSRYQDTGFTYPHNVHNILIPGVAFNSPGWAVTYQGFHLNYTTQDEDAVANVNHTISTVKAYPNPASSSLNIAFSLVNASDVTVTLTNMVGQVVATQSISNTASGYANFNTASLPTGAYFYSVVANGERSTGNVTIAH